MAIFNQAREDSRPRAGVDLRSGEARVTDVGVAVADGGVAIPPRVRELVEELANVLGRISEFGLDRLDELQVQLHDALRWIPEAAEAMQRVQVVRDAYREPLRAASEEELRTELPGVAARVLRESLAYTLHNAVDGEGSDLGWLMAQSRVGLARLGVFEDLTSIVAIWGRGFNRFAAALLGGGYHFPSPATDNPADTGAGQPGRPEPNAGSGPQSAGPVDRSGLEVGQSSGVVRTPVEWSDGEFDEYLSDGEFGERAERWARLGRPMSPDLVRTPADAPAVPTADAQETANTETANTETANETPVITEDWQQPWPTLAAAIESSGLDAGLPARLMEPLRRWSELARREELSAFPRHSLSTDPAVAALLVHRAAHRDGDRGPRISPGPR